MQKHKNLNSWNILHIAPCTSERVKTASANQNTYRMQYKVPTKTTQPCTVVFSSSVSQMQFHGRKFFHETMKKTCKVSISHSIHNPITKHSAVSLKRDLECETKRNNTHTCRKNAYDTNKWIHLSFSCICDRNYKETFAYGACWRKRQKFSLQINTFVDRKCFRTGS